MTDMLCPSNFSQEKKKNLAMSPMAAFPRKKKKSRKVSHDKSIEHSVEFKLAFSSKRTFLKLYLERQYYLFR